MKDAGQLLLLLLELKIKKLATLQIMKIGKYRSFKGTFKTEAIKYSRFLQRQALILLILILMRNKQLSPIPTMLNSQRDRKSSLILIYLVYRSYTFLKKVNPMKLIFHRLQTTLDALDQQSLMIARCINLERIEIQIKSITIIKIQYLLLESLIVLTGLIAIRSRSLNQQEVKQHYHSGQ